MGCEVFSNFSFYSKFFYKERVVGVLLSSAEEQHDYLGREDAKEHTQWIYG